MFNKPKKSNNEFSSCMKQIDSNADGAFVMFFNFFPKSLKIIVTLSKILERTVALNASKISLCLDVSKFGTFLLGGGGGSKRVPSDVSISRTRLCVFPRKARPGCLSKVVG